MPYPIRPFTEGMTPVPLSPEARRQSEAARVSRKAQDEVLRRHGSLEEATEAGERASLAFLAADEPTP